ncbi:MAG: type 4a pilus biogenesis protein PilO [Candidatus Omnitrophota bacterium]
MEEAGSRKNNEIVVITVVVVAVTLFVALALIYLPFMRQQRVVKVKISEERDNSLVLAEIGVLEKYIDVYKKRLSDDRGLSWLLKEASGIAAAENLKVVSSRPLEPIKQAGFTKLSVELETVSTYYELGSFVSSIESSGKFLKIEKMDAKRLDLSNIFEQETGRYKGFDVNAKLVVSTIVWKE